MLQGKVYDSIKEEIVSGNFIELFTPWQILQAIDEIGSGSLNYIGNNTLRDAIKQSFLIAQLRNNKIKTKRPLVVPSSFLVKQASYELE